MKCSGVLSVGAGPLHIIPLHSRGLGTEYKAGMRRSSHPLLKYIVYLPNSLLSFSISSSPLHPSPLFLPLLFSRSYEPLWMRSSFSGASVQCPKSQSFYLSHTLLHPPIRPSLHTFFFLHSPYLCPPSPPFLLLPFLLTPLPLFLSPFLFSSSVFPSISFCLHVPLCLRELWMARTEMQQTSYWSRAPGTRTGTSTQRRRGSRRETASRIRGRR
jgi:hypothetical protein